MYIIELNPLPKFSIRHAQRLLAGHNWQIDFVNFHLTMPNDCLLMQPADLPYPHAYCKML